jgi:hypothetical protein
MTVYTVHIPGFRNEASGFLSHSSPAESALADAAFVPERFSRAAFFLGPFWLAWHRLWLALIEWLVVFFALCGAATRFVEPGTALLIGVLLEALLGLEGNNLRRTELAQRGYRLVDVAAGAKRDDAERSFYRRYFETGNAPNLVTVSRPPPLPHASNPHAEVLGLFPLPEDPR